MAQVSDVNYNGEHPFEIMKRDRRERRRQLQQNQSITLFPEEEEEEEEEEIPTSEEEAISSRILQSAHQQIRITIDSTLFDTLGPQYADHSSLLRTQILPAVQTFWQQALRVA
eukprot:4860479-Ditylum_brightwellii.AAC.1